MGQSMEGKPPPFAKEGADLIQGHVGLLLRDYVVSLGLTHLSSPPETALLFAGCCMLSTSTTAACALFGAVLATCAGVLIS